MLAASALAGCTDSPLAPAASGAAPSSQFAANASGFGPQFADFAAMRAMGGFVEGFDIIPFRGDTTVYFVPPAPWNPSDWSIVRHQRDQESWYRIGEMQAWHGNHCQRPIDTVEPTHAVSEYPDMVFLCRNHMMTANNAGGGYGVTFLTPSRLVDFSERTAVVRFDVATQRESGGDWIDLWLTPYADNLVTPLDDSIPDLQGEPRNAIHVRMTSPRNRSAFEASVIRNFEGTRLRAASDSSYEEVFAARGLATSAVRRDTFELHVSRTRVKFGMPRYNLWWVDTEIPGGLDWSQAVMQLGHHSLNLVANGGKPGSWHWDNIGAAPAVPFTILRADRRYVDDRTDNAEVNFPSPAPAGAFLRASVFGNTEVRFTGADGRPGEWQPLGLQAQERQDPARFASAWMPVPAGTRSVRFRQPSPGLSLAAALAANRDELVSVSVSTVVHQERWMVRDVEIWAGPTAPSGSSSAPQSGDVGGNGRGNERSKAKRGDGG